MSHENMPTHARACLDAIDSIGGDPATVGELVAALRALRSECRKAGFTTADSHGWPMALYSADAVLAKLPENSND